MSFEQWSIDDLRAACAERGLDSTGDADALVARLETSNTSEPTGRGQRKRGRDALAATSALVSACRAVCVPAVREALELGADVNCRTVSANNRQGRTPLMLACMGRDWTEGEAAVHVLLQHHAVVSLADNKGVTALHLAARYSSLAVVTALVAAGAQPGALDSLERATSLHGCCDRDTDADTVAIATLMLDAGVDVNATASSQWTPLHFACQSSSVALVELLLSRGADAKAVTDKNQTALMFACDNAVHGQDIIPLLVRAGVDVNLVSADGQHALHYAYGCSGAMLRALAPHVPASSQLAAEVPRYNHMDPISAMTEATVFGFVPTPSYFGSVVASSKPAAYCWAMLRNGAPICVNESKRDIFVVMAASTDTQLWQLVAGELNSMRHPATQDTLLHVAARANNINAVRACCALFRVNPLLRNAAGQLPVQCATDEAVRTALRSYAMWRPLAIVTQWYGPFFRQRARTWLLVCARWRKSGEFRLARDMCELIVRYIAAAEETFVRRLTSAE